jgi:uncharacterized membrane protein YkvA (DUF1232 family)
MSMPYEQSELGAQLLGRFADWIGTLGDDAAAFAVEVENPENARAVRIALAGALNYLIKSVDLIEDGIENLGFLDDAMVLRLALYGAHGAIPEGVQGLRGDAGILLEFLGVLSPRFTRFVEGLPELEVRGRTAMAMVEDPEALNEFLQDVREFSSRYRAPSMGQDPSLLVKAHAFLDAKLPKL